MEDVQPTLDDLDKLCRAFPDSYESFVGLSDAKEEEEEEEPGLPLAVPRCEDMETFYHSYRRVFDKAMNMVREMYGLVAETQKDRQEGKTDQPQPFHI
jgi:hypothetical protein